MTPNIIIQEIPMTTNEIEAIPLEEINFKLGLYASNDEGEIFPIYYSFNKEKEMKSTLGTKYITQRYDEYTPKLKSNFLYIGEINNCNNETTIFEINEFDIFSGFQCLDFSSSIIEKELNSTESAFSYIEYNKEEEPSLSFYEYLQELKFLEPDANYIFYTKNKGLFSGNSILSNYWLYVQANLFYNTNNFKFLNLLWSEEMPKEEKFLDYSQIENEENKIITNYIVVANYNTNYLDIYESLI